jgi:hypothetical protein
VFTEAPAEAATGLIVLSGQKLPLGGAPQNLHAVMRRILGYAVAQGASETALAFTATIQ